MSYYKIDYSNYNFSICTLALEAKTKEDAIELVKIHEGNRRVSDEKATEITENEYLQYPNQTGRFDEIRF